MTTIAYRDGIIAADSRATYTSEAGGARIVACRKLYRKTIGKGRRQHDVIIGTAGESAPGLLFVEWFGSGKEPPTKLIDGDADFEVLVVTKKGIYTADKYCTLEEIEEPYYAIGSGSKAAFAAMDCGKSAKEAVRIAAKRDPYTGGPIRAMSLLQPVRTP